MIQGQFSELSNLVHLNLANPTISNIEKLMNLGSKLILVRWRIRSYEFDYEQLKSNDFFNILYNKKFNWSTNVCNKITFKYWDDARSDVKKLFK